MRVLFKLRRNKRNPNARANIYCRIKSDSGHATDFSTFIAVMPANWDSKKQRIRGGSLDANNNNMKLEQIRSDITRTFLVGQTLSAQALADIYTGKRKTSHTFDDLLTHFDAQCLTTYGDTGTYTSYRVRIANIRAFLADRKTPDILPEQFIAAVADDFVAWMKKTERSHTYIVRHTQVLKNVMKLAIRREWLRYDPLAGFELKKRERVNTDHLTRAQITRIETMDWQGNLQRVADLFLFSCYTGLHYEDAQTLTPDDIKPGLNGRLWLYKVRGKYTDSEFFDVNAIQTVPLHQRALALIEKYQGVDKLPKISNSKYNKALKHIAFQADVSVTLTVKIARKTFTDILLNEVGISADAVAVMLGHSSSRHVKHYARADERRVAKEMEDVAW